MSRAGHLSRSFLFSSGGFFWFVLLVCGFSSVAAAEVKESLALKSEKTSTLSAHQRVESVTELMINVIRAKKDTLDKNPETFYAAVQDVLEPVVDFPYIARLVMGSHAKKATKSQRELFAKVFKEGLVSTYAKGMAGFGDREIKVLPPEKDIGTRRTVGVTQEVKTDRGISRVDYTMKKRSDGEWKLVNVILDGVNLGITFRGQFAHAMKKYNGNIDLVVENWSK